MRLVTCVVGVGWILVLAGCAADTGVIHRELADKGGERSLPKKILLLPVEIRVHEVSAGGVVEKVDAWSKTASANAVRYVRSLSNGGVIHLAEPPSLSAAEQAQLDQHIALYEAVAGSALLATASPIGAWRTRAKDSDYTLGPGLAPLAEHTGIDAAMIVIGTDYISSAGRKAAMVMGVLLGALGGVVIVPQGGVSFLSVGVVDMHTGHLLWLKTDHSGTIDFRNEQDLHRVLDRMFQTYPGVAAAGKKPA